MLQFLRHPTAQVVTVHLLWQFILLALYKILIWVTPHIFSSGPTAFLMPQILSVVASIAAFRIMLLTSTRCNISFGFTAKSSVTGILVGLLLGALAYMIYVVISLSGGWYRIIGIDNRYYFRFALLLPSCHRGGDDFSRIYIPNSGKKLGYEDSTFGLFFFVWISTRHQLEWRWSLAQWSPFRLGCSAHFCRLYWWDIIFGGISIDAKNVDTYRLALRLGHRSYNIFQ